MRWKQEKTRRRRQTIIIFVPVASFVCVPPKQNANNPLVQKSFWGKGGPNRRKLSYCQEHQTLHRSVCIAFGKSADSFISGWLADGRHVHHERSMAHRTRSEAYFLHTSESVWKRSLLSGTQVVLTKGVNQEETSGSSACVTNKQVYQNTLRRPATC